MNRVLPVLLLAVCALMSLSISAHSLVKTVAKVKKSVVGIGVFDPIASPRASLQGTGFVVANGQYIITNHHVVANPLDNNSKQYRVVFAGSGSNPKVIKAEVIEIDELHDLALLRIDEKLAPITLAKNRFVEDGTEVAFTGFPISSVLGLYPATHRGIIAATTPVITPSAHASQLDINTLRRLRDPYYIYQMDATAYPGNSGSAVYDAETGEVIAVINKVFVKKTKEAVLSDPSGITYSIPVKYVYELLEKANVALN